MTSDDGGFISSRQSKIAIADLVITGSDEHDGQIGMTLLSDCHSFFRERDRLPVKTIRCLELCKNLCKNEGISARCRKYTSNSRIWVFSPGQMRRV